MNAKIAASYAEVILSSEFLEAKNTAFTNSQAGGGVDSQPVDDATEYRQAFDAALVETLTRVKNPDRFAWELGRTVVRHTLQGANYGHFTEYALAHSGDIPEATNDTDLLPPGAPGVVSTNSAVSYLKDTVDEPVDYLKNALLIIRSNQNVGPENYATSIKIMSDLFRAKYDAVGNETIRDEELKELTLMITSAMRGFAQVSKKDTPNFVEITNICSSVRMLPKGAFSKESSRILLHHSVEQLHTLSPKALRTLLGAIGKLDLEGTGDVAGGLITLAIGQGYRFETTRDLIVALSAASNVPKGTGAKIAFARIVSERHDLETQASIDEALGIAKRLHKIVTTNVDDPELTLMAAEMAAITTKIAASKLRAQFQKGQLTPESLADLKHAVQQAAKLTSQISKG